LIKCILFYVIIFLLQFGDELIELCDFRLQNLHGLSSD
jgi:hypothetical protein